MVKPETTNVHVQGDIEISQEVLEVIAGIATHEVKGVYGMQTTISNEVLNYFNNKEYRRGVHLSKHDHGLQLDIYVYLNYGVKVPEVARQIQEKVREQIYYMTEVTIAEVNVHIVDIIPQKMALADVTGTAKKD